MTPTVPADSERIRFLYRCAERRYLKALRAGHAFVDATSQTTQRLITLASFALIRAVRRDVQCFNDLLVQYPAPGKDLDNPNQIVPDNMVVLHPQPINAEHSFNTPLQPAGPFLVLEYPSKGGVWKDYEAHFEKYEKELRVPYYLVFSPGADEFTLFKLKDEKYASVAPDSAGRCAIPELELEVAILDGWVRYWFRSELLPLPGDLLQQLNAVKGDLAATQAKLETERQSRIALEAELARMREELAKAKAPK